MAIAATRIFPTQPIELQFINPGKNPRKHFDPVKLRELRDSIQQQGMVLTPIILRRLENGRYKIIDGERRFRCCQQLRFKTIPATVLETTEEEAYVVSVVANLHRENLNPIDEAVCYWELQEQGYTQQDIAKLVGKSHHFVWLRLQLLKLPKRVQEMICSGQLRVCHAQKLQGFTGKSRDMLKLARMTVDGDMKIQEVEELIARLNVSANGSHQENGKERFSQGAMLRTMRQHATQIGRTKAALSYINDLDNAGLRDFLQHVGIYPQEVIISKLEEIFRLVGRILARVKKQKSRVPSSAQNG